MKLEQLTAMDFGNGLVIFGTERSVTALGVVCALGRDAQERLQAIQEIKAVLAEQKTGCPAVPALVQIERIINALPKPRTERVRSYRRKPGKKR
jgi:RecB family endonuclease NucS